VVIESGPLAARVHDLLVAQKVKVLVADPTREAWSWKNVKRKTDPDDALKLVRLALVGQINPVHVPAPAVRQLRALLEYRRAIVGEQTRCKNRIRATLLCTRACGWPAARRPGA
jgi:transposase